MDEQSPLSRKTHAVGSEIIQGIGAKTPPIGTSSNKPTKSALYSGNIAVIVATDQFTILSGGQSGVDRAALDAAIHAGIPHGGYCPRRRWAEDGPISHHYKLIELESPRPEDRTLANIEASDATIVLHGGVLDAGTEFTLKLLQKHDSPYLQIDCSRLGVDQAVAQISAFVAQQQPGCLNVAGPRASVWAQGYALSRRIFQQFLRSQLQA